MRVADEFNQKSAYTKPLADLELEYSPSDHEVYGAALAFQADLQV